VQNQSLCNPVGKKLFTLGENKVLSSSRSCFWQGWGADA